MTPGLLSGPQVLPRLNEVPMAAGTSTHSHPLRRVASQKERGREEADKKDSFCLDTNILVISTDGKRKTKKST